MYRLFIIAFFIVAPAVYGADVEFSNESGFYPASIELKLATLNDKDIWYTLDGSTPQPSHLTPHKVQYGHRYLGKEDVVKKSFSVQTHEYKAPLVLDDRSEAEVDAYARVNTTSTSQPKVKPIKDSIKNDAKRIINSVLEWFDGFLDMIANLFGFINYLFTNELAENIIDTPKIPKLAYTQGTLPKATVVTSLSNESDAKPISKTYFIGNKLSTDLPVINLTVEPEELFGFTNGILVYGEKRSNWSKRTDVDATVALFSADKQLQVEQRAKVRVHGNASRNYTIKSLRIYPQTSEGENGFDYDVFEDDKPLGLQRINLRNSGQDYEYSYIADASMHQAFAGLNIATQRYQPYLVFLNGQYYGILNARDRRDHYFLQGLYNLPNRKVDHLKRSATVKRGDKKAWQQLLTTIDNNAADGKEFYSLVAQQMDITSFIDYFAAEVYVANTDWPGNNIAYWRYAGSKEHPITQDGYTDGRWRWALYDLDLYCDSNSSCDSGVEHNSIERLMEYGSKKANQGSMFRHLIKNEKIQQEFLIRFSDLLNSHFLPERFTAIIRRNEAGIEDEMPRHIRRWLHPKSMSHWRSSVDKLVTFFQLRPQYQRRHLRDAFDLGKHYSVQVDISDIKAGSVELNTLTLAGSQPVEPEPEYVPLHLPWEGVYFEELPLTVEAVANDGFEFSHWQADGVSLDDPSQPQQVVYPQQALKLKAVFDR